MRSFPRLIQAQALARAATLRRIVSSEIWREMRGPQFFWSGVNLRRWFSLHDRVKFRIDGQFFNIFNQPNFGYPALVYAGIPGKRSTQTGFGAMTYATRPPACSGLAWAALPE
jgi:hypothetical protein